MAGSPTISGVSAPQLAWGLRSSIYGVAGSAFNITVTGLTGGDDYKVQLLFYDPWNDPDREMDVTIEGITTADIIFRDACGGDNTKGAVLTETVTVSGDGILDLSVLQVTDGSHISGLIVNRIASTTSSVHQVGGVNDLDLALVETAVSFRPDGINDVFAGVNFWGSGANTSAANDTRVSNTAPNHITGPGTAVMAGVSAPQLAYGFRSSIYGDMNITVTGLTGGNTYTVQVLIHDPWGDVNRQADFDIEGSETGGVMFFAAQGSSTANGAVLTETVAVSGDGILDINITKIGIGGGPHISGLIVNRIASTPSTVHQVDDVTDLDLALVETAVSFRPDGVSDVIAGVNFWGSAANASAASDPSVSNTAAGSVQNVGAAPVISGVSSLQLRYALQSKLHGANIDVAVSDLYPGAAYKVQLLLHDGFNAWGRTVDIAIEGAELTTVNYITEQGGNDSKAAVVTAIVTVSGDGILNMNLARASGAGDNPHLSGLIVNRIARGTVIRIR